MSPTSDVTIFPKAAPIITATARSNTLPRMMKFLNSLNMRPPKALHHSTAARVRGYTEELKTPGGKTYEPKSWKLTIEYDGTKYSGWQEQRNARTVQGQLRKAAEDFLGVEVDIQGAGRTDAGVHARAQVAHLRVRPPKESQRRNWPTPDEIL